MSKKNKMMASILAMSMALANVTSIVADAATIPSVESNFEYDLQAEIISDSQVKLTFYTTVNPGVQELGFVMIYDPNKFTAVAQDIDSEFQSAIKTGIGNNPEMGIYSIGLTVDPDFLTGQQIDYEDNFYVSIYLQAKDGNARDEGTYQFSSAIKDYKSLAEDIKIETQFESYTPGVDEPDVEISSSVVGTVINHNYKVGDSDFNDEITLADVTRISSLVTFIDSTNTISEVDEVNSRISANTVSVLNDGSKFYWGERCSDFIITHADTGYSFACTDVCDADLNGYIESEDAQAVADYYAAVASNVPVESYVNTYMAKTIYIS
jgi:hypothetical protein